MTKPGLILLGAGGHAHACIDVIEQEGKFAIAGLVDSAGQAPAQHFGYDVIGTDEDLPALAARFQYALIAVGQIETPALRTRLFQQARRLGFILPTIIAPGAHVSRHARLGAGSIVMHGAIVNAGVRVGDNCIINTRALLEHDVTVGDHCHVATGAILNGAVQVGAGSFLGSGCVVKQGVTLGACCIVGMAVAVRHSQADHVRFLG